MTEFRVDIEDASGNKLGSGPLQSVSKWRYTARFDRAGAIDFAYAANDPQASIVTNRRIARAYALLNGAWTEVGAGRIDTIDTSPGNDGRVSLSASGLDLIAELGDRSVGTLEIGTGSGATHSAALTAISALAPVGWTFTPASAPDNDYIYARYGGESVLGALVHLAERTQTHFYRSTARTLVFTSSFTSSGVRAIQATGDLVAETCAIVSLRRTVDTHDLLTRIYPYGSGQGAARLTLAATNRVAPSGYTLNAASNYIENDAATAAYGLVDHPEIEFKEITPISNTDADLQAAANMLFDAALEELRRRSSLADQETYSLKIAGCSQLLRPMQTIRVVYRDVSQNIDINEDLYILEATWEVDESGVRTSQLVVSTQDRWPESDSSAAAERAVAGRVFQAHPQINANGYCTGYTKNVDIDNVAEFRFRFGDEVVNLQQVLFEFQLLQFESTIKNVGATSITTESGGGSTESSTSDGSHSHTYTIPGHSHTYTYTIPSHSHTYTYTIPSHSHTYTYTIPAHSHTFTYTIPGHSHTFTYTIPAHTHTNTISDHSHGITVYGVDNPTANVLARVVYFEADNNRFVAQFGAGNDEGESTASGGGTTVVASASQSASGSTTQTTSDSNSANSTTQLSQTVTAASSTVLAQTAASASSTVLSQTVTGATTTTTSASGSTTDGGGTHSHTLTIPAHTHAVTASLSTIYGIFRDEQANTYVMSNLQYQVNSGGWNYLEDDATDAGDGWYQLDVTSLVMNAATFRPVQTNNLLEMRAGTKILSISYIPISARYLVTVTDVGPLAVASSVTISGTTNFDGTYVVASVDTGSNTFQLNGGDDHPTETAGNVVFDGKATIDAQLSVRNTIQAISYV